MGKIVQNLENSPFIVEPRDVTVIYNDLSEVEEQYDDIKSALAEIKEISLHSTEEDGKRELEIERQFNDLIKQYKQIKKERDKLRKELAEAKRKGNKKGRGQSIIKPIIQRRVEEYDVKEFEIVVDGSGGNRLVKYIGKNSKVKIPRGVTEIGPSAFKNLTSIKVVDIPSSVIRISNAAFRGCRSLTSVIIPSDARLKNVGQNAFGDCIRLTNITIPDRVKIAANAFYGCTILNGTEHCTGDKEPKKPDSRYIWQRIGIFSALIASIIIILSILVIFLT